MQVLREGPVQISQAIIDAAWKRRAKQQRIIISDKECRGLALVVGSTGMSWRFDFKPRGINPATGRRYASKSIIVGNPASLSSKEARQEAGVLKGRTQAGGDPAAERREKLATERAARAAAEADVLTVRQLIDLYDEKHVSTLRPATRRDVLSRLRLHLRLIEKKPANAIGRRDAAQVVDKAAKAGHTTARRVRDYSRAMWGWAQRRGTLPEGKPNPWLNAPAPGEDIPRDRVLVDDELGLIWRAAETLPKPHGQMIRFLALTLARREEASAVTWGEISPDMAIWTQPAGRTKNKKSHIVHLSEPARAILKEMLGGDDAKLPPAGTLIFGMTATRPITTHSWAKRELDKAILKAQAEAAAPDAAPPAIPHWTLHDFRRAGVTWLSTAARIPPHISDRLLNHTEGTIKGVAAIYNRGEFIDERRHALDTWGAHVAACAAPDASPDNVLRLRQAGRRGK